MSGQQRKSDELFLDNGRASSTVADDLEMGIVCVVARAR